MSPTCEICESADSCLGGRCPCDLCGEFIADVPREIGNMLLNQVREMRDVMGEFCDRVEKGEVRSKRTYAKFCAILKREPKT